MTTAEEVNTSLQSPSSPQMLSAPPNPLRNNLAVLDEIPSSTWSTPVLQTRYNDGIHESLSGDGLTLKVQGDVIDDALAFVALSPIWEDGDLAFLQTPESRPVPEISDAEGLGSCCRETGESALNGEKILSDLCAELFDFGAPGEQELFGDLNDLPSLIPTANVDSAYNSAGSSEHIQSNISENTVGNDDLAALLGLLGAGSREPSTPVMSTVSPPDLHSESIISPSPSTPLDFSLFEEDTPMSSSPVLFPTTMTELMSPPTYLAPMSPSPSLTPLPLGTQIMEPKFILSLPKSADGLYDCPHPGCENRFARRFNLKTHYMAKHQPLKAFRCNSCEGSFTRKYDLTRHTKTKHGSVTAVGGGIKKARGGRKSNVAVGTKGRQ